MLRWNLGLFVARAEERGVVEVNHLAGGPHAGEQDEPPGDKYVGPLNEESSAARHGLGLPVVVADREYSI